MPTSDEPERPEDPDKPETPEEHGLVGDADGDGYVTSDDALTLLRCSLGMTELECSAFTDVDRDGVITASDALSVLRFSVGFEPDEGSLIGRQI